MRGLRPVRAGRFFTEKRAEAAKLHPVAARKRCHDLLQDGVDDVLHVALEQVRIARGNALDELRFDHAGPLAIGSPEKCSLPNR